VSPALTNQSGQVDVRARRRLHRAAQRFSIYEALEQSQYRQRRRLMTPGERFKTMTLRELASYIFHRLRRW
jgi:hypothetical protein